MKRIAYAGNGAIFPRNKFFASGGERKNKLVKDAEVENPSNVVLIAEFTPDRSYEAIRTGGIFKSHRPFTPFVGISAAAQVYQEPTAGALPRFAYPNESELLRADEVPEGAIDLGTGTSLNAVARHHPGKKDKFGQSCNFGFVDGHVEQTTLRETVRLRRWGDKFWSITGDNRVNVQANQFN